MPIYVYRCPECKRQIEAIETVAEGALPHVFCACDVPAMRVPQAASFGIKTRGGNWAAFYGSHGPVTKGNRKPKTISRGNGLGGHRPPPSPHRDPAMRRQVLDMYGRAAK